eukprot:g65230.t1
MTNELDFGATAATDAEPVMNHSGICGSQAARTLVDQKLNHISSSCGLGSKPRLWIIHICHLYHQLEATFVAA